MENYIWWKHGVIYHLYVRSFFDSNADGIGDLKGVISKLDYLSNLGVDGIWLSPIYSSPMVDFGYDVADYRSIDKQYGTMDDFKLLLDEAHKRKIRIIMDLIMNHTSDQHPWFLESRSSKDNPKRDWYIWHSPINGKKPNNWKTSFGGSSWEFDHQTQEYYLHSFFKEQPDLNWRNDEMQKAYFKEIKFWLDLGVDGFRLDVFNLIIKDKQLRNNPKFFGFMNLRKQIYTQNRKTSYKIAKMLRSLLDKYPQTMSVGEIYTFPPGDSSIAASYLANGDDSLHMTFDFSLIFKTWNAKKYYRCIENWYSKIPPKGWACNVLSNHDLFRSINRYGFMTAKYEKAKIMAYLLLTLKGTPFIYYGEEIGMENTHIPKSRIQDLLGKKFWPLPFGRDKARTPMQWNATTNAGFSESDTPWLPINKRFKTINVENESNDKNSLLNLYVSLIKIRRKYVSLQMGDWMPIVKGENGVIVYARMYERERIVVMLNFTSSKKTIRIENSMQFKVIISSHRQRRELINDSHLVLFPFESTIMKKYNTKIEE